MNERTWWSTHVKPRWHRPMLSFVAWKVEDKFFSGMPDVDAMFDGTAAKIELKYEAKWPVRPDTKLWFSYNNPKDKVHTIISAIQWNYLEQYKNARGNAFVFIGVGKDWLLLEHGTFDNVPMTKDELAQVAVAASLDSNTYETIMNVPFFIVEKYGK